MKRTLLALFLILLSVSVAAAQTGQKKKRPLPFEFGRVVLNNFSEKAGLAPVVFDHWLHRSKYTCRVCHVDIGFAMKGDLTRVNAAGNMAGYYCGTCHDGKTRSEGQPIFASCERKPSLGEGERCLRCHSFGKEVKKKYDFAEFTRRFPKERFGNGIDWEKTEAEGYVKPVDVLPGVTVRKKALPLEKDFALDARLESMPTIIFSHKKHTVWNGCELCHPEIFLGVKKGATRYSMEEIFKGEYCGVCHMNVAFPLLDCQRCHSRPVQWRE
jgi:c(7)-type cytochrome triheme protein